MRRSKLRIPVLAVTVAVVFVFPLLAPTPHRIDQSHFELIQRAMTRADVEAIFGVPSGRYDWAEPDYATVTVSAVIFSVNRAQANPDPSRDLDVPMSWAPKREFWVSRHGAFPISFNGQGRVVAHGSWTSVRIVPPWQRWWQALRGR